MHACVRACVRLHVEMYGVMGRDFSFVDEALYIVVCSNGDGGGGGGVPANGSPQAIEQATTPPPPPPVPNSNMFTLMNIGRLREENGSHRARNM